MPTKTYVCLKHGVQFEPLEKVVFNERLFELFSRIFRKILEKSSQSVSHPRCTGKSWKKSSQSVSHPRDAGKFWKKPHNLCPIPGTPGKSWEKPHNLCPSPGPRKILKKNSHYYTFDVGCCGVGSDKLCRGPLRGQSSYKKTRIVFNMIVAKCMT